MRSVPNAVNLAFGQVGEALETFDGRVLLGSRGHLTILVTGKAPDGMAHRKWQRDAAKIRRRDAYAA